MLYSAFSFVDFYIKLPRTILEICKVMPIVAFLLGAIFGAIAFALLAGKFHGSAAGLGIATTIVIVALLAFMFWVPKSQKRS